MRIRFLVFSGMVFLMLAFTMMFAGGEESQESLHRTAKDPTVSSLGRQEVVKRMTDQALLADLAKTADDGRVRLVAVIMLNDPTLLADVMKNTTDSDVQLSARIKLAGSKKK